MRANDLKRKVKKKESTMAATKITKKGLNVPMLRNIVRHHRDKVNAFLEPIFVFQYFKFKVTFINTNWPH